MTVRSRLGAATGVALLVLLVAVVAAGAITAARSSHARALRTRRIATSLSRVLDAVLDAESAERGYPLARDRGDLGAGERAAVETEAALASLKLNLGPDDFLSLADVERLAAGARAELADLRRTLAAASSHGAAAAGTIALSGARRTFADDLRAQIVKLRSAEEEANDRYDAVLSARLDGSRYIVVAAGLVGFLLALLLNLGISRTFAAREDARRLASVQGDELRSANAALARSNQDLDQFAYATSHDLKAPLRGITHLAAWIEEDLGSAMKPKVKEHLAMLHGRVRRLEALIDGILAFSRAGSAFTEPEPLDLEALVVETVELVGPPENVHVDVEGPMPRLIAERVPLQQIFMNLIQNAIKHGCAGGGSIRVAAADERDYYRFTVEDSGPGIETRYHERIFGIFQTLASRDQVEGTGIGLAVVKKLVDSRGGGVRLESEPGHGAIFSFTWPKQPPARAT